VSSILLIFLHCMSKLCITCEFNGS
jgi:hypothetical protein